MNKIWSHILGGIIGAGIMVCLIIFSIFIFPNPIKINAEEKPIQIVIPKTVLMDLEINDSVQGLLQNKETNEKVYLFYDRYTKNRKITFNIILHALAEKMPLHFAFGLAWGESRLYEKAENKGNKNRSRDIGIFQLNTDSYNNIPVSELFKIEINSKLGIQHYMKEYSKYKNLYVAIMTYNCGDIKYINNEKTVQLFITVVAFVRDIDARFNEHFFGNL